MVRFSSPTAERLEPVSWNYFKKNKYWFSLLSCYASQRVPVINFRTPEVTVDKHTHTLAQVWMQCAGAKFVFLFLFVWRQFTDNFRWHGNAASIQTIDPLLLYVSRLFHQSSTSWFMWRAALPPFLFLFSSSFFPPAVVCHCLAGFASDGHSELLDWGMLGGNLPEGSALGCCLCAGRWLGFRGRL